MKAALNLNEVQFFDAESKDHTLFSKFENFALFAEKFESYHFPYVARF